MPRIPCEFCGDPVDTTLPGSFYKATGWAMVRSGGGAHGLSLSSGPLAWAHGTCVDREKRHEALGQEQLRLGG